MRHFLAMALYALCLSAYFAALLRDQWKPALKLFAGLFTLMVASVFVLGWLMLWLAP